MLEEAGWAAHALDVNSVIDKLLDVRGARPGKVVNLAEAEIRVRAPPPARAAGPARAPARRARHCRRLARPLPPPRAPQLGGCCFSRFAAAASFTASRRPA